MDYKIELLKPINMQNGFNHRIVMIISLLIVFCLSSCRTSKKSIEKSRIEIEKNEVKLNKVDSTIFIQKNDVLNKVDSLSWFNSIKNYDISFLGNSNEDFGTIEQTLNGWKFIGKIKVNLKGVEEKGDSIQKSNNHQLTNKLSKVNSSSKTEVESNNHQIKVEKEKEKFSFGPTFGILMLALIILIYYLIKRFKY